ncbi:FAD-dependent monooxygenase [Streptosporangium sandarakinum]|uniref:2-polyprenyl-6-methoxyphenol hydroxylase-like FAD-dependent oxidoreductase n=1 Tax=Streptosporangium sandarakinum TaxID=1260955 RepID=A0A852V4S4_9ACTN|nr:FAD-dependent monooxygenase [Streptosporangium sandarakinum]NYF40925.1 2-polyprenyl-6-methoxyphenol hydroxylase-like FAD-dependent oxidoreductase [Streptosporangium sandarakinum]
MKIACVGGGPASLYFSILMKRVDPSHVITVHERNPAGSTYGWGVTYWGELLNDLHGADPESACTIEKNSVHWDRWEVHVHDRTTVATEDWGEGFGIGRHQLLDILTERARSLGVHIEFEHEITDRGELADADLVVAGDGVNSLLRERHTDHFGSEVTVGRNVYVWLGTTKVFRSFTFTFVETAHGWIWCYGYGFSKDHSTCVIECSPTTWKGLGLHQANRADGLALLEKLFADALDGHPLITQAHTEDGTHWLNFRTLTNRTWYHDNLVLLGDAAHTTHYSIGAGTALALGDAAFLVNALHGETELQTALARYDRERQAVIRLSLRAARYSARWYESLPRYVGLPPEQLIALLGQRHSPLLPHVPPRLYYRLGQAAEQFRSLRNRGRRPDPGPHGPNTPGQSDEMITR